MRGDGCLYNEIDAKAAAWLRELVAGGHIAKGVVDERSIADLGADDVRGYERVHLFAGIGGWDYALRLAGWPEGVPVWTGSCPCQPFSCAGKGRGTADERHLWPEMFKLIRECRPGYVFGEQVSSAIGHGWLDGVFADLEAEGYACGACVLGAHSVGAPHIRQRLYWVAYAKGRNGRLPVLERQPRQNSVEPEWCSGTLGVAYAGLQRQEKRQVEATGIIECSRVCDTDSAGPQGRQQRNGRTGELSAWPSGAWSDYRIIGFRDGKARRIEPFTEPLVDGLPRGMVPSGDISLPYVRNTGEARVMRLKGYGNAIVPQAAATFIKAFLEATQ